MQKSFLSCATWRLVSHAKSAVQASRRIHVVRTCRYSGSRWERDRMECCFQVIIKKYGALAKSTPTLNNSCVICCSSFFFSRRRRFRPMLQLAGAPPVKRGSGECCCCCLCRKQDGRQVCVCVCVFSLAAPLALKLSFEVLAFCLVMPGIISYV